MFKRSINGKTPGIIKQSIALMLCLCMLLPMGNSFFAVSAQEDGTDIVSDGFTELEEANDNQLNTSKLSATAIALLERETTQMREEPVNEPPEQEPVSGDGTTIEKITVRWLSQSTGEIEPAGFGRLKLSPDSGKLANQQFQIDFSLSGQTAYEERAIEIIFPAYLWLDRDNAEPGDLTLSVPEDPETGVDFVWKRVGDNIVITNTKKLPAASKVLIQGTFRNVDAWKMIDETLSNEFSVSIVVTTSAKNELTMTSNSIDAYVDTSVHVTGASKTAYDSNKKEYTVYWESIPNNMPSALLANITGDPKDYVYVDWYISGTASGSQPFVMTVTDTVEDKYGGIMLGAAVSTNNVVVSPDGKTVTATLYDGYTDRYKTAHIWTAYPKDQFEEGEEVQFNNEQTITVTGKDDGISTTKSAKATVDTWNPIHYKFVKIWDDNDNENGVRPDELLLKIYDAAYSYTTPAENVYMDESYTDEEDSSRWIYEWTDNGQPGHSYDVEEYIEKDKIEGDHQNHFDEQGHNLHWIYTLTSSKYDENSHTWEYVNSYNSYWGKYRLSEMHKYVEAKYQNSKVDATTDSALNDLLHGNAVEIQYPVDATLSAAKTAVGFGAVPNTFVLEDGTYRLNDIAYPVEDVNIGAVIMQTPIVWEYTNFHEDTGWYDREPVEDQTITLYGYVNNAWVAMATVTTEGTLKAIEGSGATVEGRRVDLPDNTAKVKTEIKSYNAAIVKMGYTVCLRLNPTDAMKTMVQSFIDKQDYVMFPVYNKADGYVVYDGDSDVNIEGVVYHPGDHVADVYDMATGYVHGRKYKVAASLAKSFKVTDNDIINSSVVIHSKITLTQQSNLTIDTEYNKAIQNGDIPNSTSGTYYDLLPYGVSPDLTTIKANNNDTVAASYVIENYKNSKRTLLVIKVNNINNIEYVSDTKSSYETYPAKGYKNSHTIEFDSLVSWDIIQEYGLDYMRNVAAYEADEDWIGSVNGWEGEPDDPTYGNNIRSGNAVGNAAGYMTGLDNNRKDPSFVYAGCDLEYTEIDVIATSSLWKRVQANGSGQWGNGLQESIFVEEGGKYVYQLSMKSAEDTDTQDIIIIDSLENYVPTKDDGSDHGDTQWHGSLEAIDVSDLESKGIKADIYYSTVKNLDVSRTAMDGGKDKSSVLNHLQNDRDSNGNLIWSTKAPAKMADVTAIAVDARKTVDGEDFILLPEESLNVYLRMKAPFEEDNDSPFYFKGSNGTNHELNAHAYNAVYLDCLQNVNGQNTRAYINYNYTKVGIYTKYIHVTKVWDDANNADGYRPESLTVHLLANDEDTGDFVILNEENNWSGTFNRVHTYDENGKEIIFDYYEDPFENSDKYTFTRGQTPDKDGHIEAVLINSLTPEQIEIPVKKTWAGDNDNAFGTRPDYVVVRLLADGVFTGKTLTLREDNAGNWAGKFTGLNKYRDNRKEIVYTIEEEYVDNYLSEVDGFEIKNTYHPMGDLIVSKTVENTTNVSANTEFTFELELVNKSGDPVVSSPVVDKYAYTVYNADGSVYSSGEIGDGEEFKLKGGQRIVISDIPTHVSYTVTEKSAAGFTQSSVSGNEGVIRSGDNKADFTNTYSSNGLFQINVKKSLTNRDLLRRQFRFDLLDENDNVIDSAYNDIGGNASFATIKYTEADHDKWFTYRVVEYDGGMPGFTYDKTVYTVKVYVYDNGKGTMVCNKEYIKEGKSVTDIAFNNEYKATGSLALRLWKTIDRNMTANEFTFDLYNESYEIKGTATNDETGVVVFNELEFNESDIGNTYLYFAREQKGADKTVIYSDTVLGYAITVSDNGNGTLSFSSQAYDLSEYFKSCEACNGSSACSVCNGFGYQLKAAIDKNDLGSAITPIIHNDLEDGSLSVTKHVSTTSETLPDEEFRFKIVLLGDKVKDGDFTYKIIQVDEVEFTQPEETEDTDNFVAGLLNNIKASIENIISPKIYTVSEPAAPLALGDEETKSGKWVNGEFEFVLHGGQKATFEDIPAGTIYQVWEETAKGWMLVSQSNTSGIIGSMEESAAEFTNRYQPEIATANFIGVKYFDSKATHVDNNGNIFEFVLLDEDGNAIEYVDAQQGGLITFSTLTFDKKGTYKYTIREVAGSDLNIHYDNHDEHVTVKVKEDSNGNLYAEVEYDKDGIVFENRTMPGTLEITKLTEGLNDVNKNVEFRFRVKFFNPNGAPVDDDSFTWFVKDTDTGDILGAQKADSQALSTGVSGEKVAAINNQAIMPIAGEHTGLLNDSSTGVLGSVKWSLYADGALVFEPLVGTDGNLRITRANSWTSPSDIPWYSMGIYSNIMSVESIGNIHAVGDLSYLFAYARNLADASDLASWDMSQATSFNNLFSGCSSLGELSFILDWDMSNVTNMSYMVGGTAITNTDLFADFDFTNVTSINGMFSGCSKLTDLTGISGWEFGSITDLSSLFSSCYSLTNITPLSNWNVSNVTTISSLFSGCSNLADLSVVIYNWDLSNVMNMSYWASGTAITNTDLFADLDLSNVVYINGMFSSCSKLTDISGLADWKFSKATDIGSLFNSCYNLEDISPLANWDVSNIRYMSNLFGYCSKLSDLSPLANWDMSNAVGINSMFQGCTALTDTSPLLQWNISNVTDLGYMFNNCSSLKSVDGLLKWDVSKVTNYSNMFYQCSSLSDLSGLARWRVVSASNGSYSGMQYMFAYCASLSNVDALSGWTFDSPVNMQYMFQFSGLENVNGLLGWAAAKPVSIIGMFYNCTKLADITGLANLNVSGCTSLYRTFNSCSALTSLAGLEEWDVSNVTAMNETFRSSGVTDLTALKKWNVSKVNNFNYAFTYCRSLQTLNGLEEWNVNGYYLNSMFEQCGVVDASAVGSWTLNGRSVNLAYMFSGCGNLTTLDFTNWDTSKVDNVLNLWTGNNVCKITFGDKFWNGSKMSGVKVYPTSPPELTTTGYWINENDEFDSNPTKYTSEELVSKKVVGTYIWQYLPPYEISFDGNGGDGSMANVKNYYHLPCELPENQYTNYGYIFVGWKDVNTGRVFSYLNGVSTIPAKVYKSGDTVKLAAVWAPVGSDGCVEYTVEHYQQDPYNPLNYVLAKTDIKRDVPGAEVNIEPIKYEGFILPDAEQYIIPENGYLTVRLYYDRIHYTIHFDGNGAEYGSMADMEMIGGIAETLPESGFGSTTGAFLGWNTKKDGDGAWYYSGRPVNNLAGNGETITLYAQWMKINQSVESTTGEIVVSCKPGQTIVIQGIPAGVTYEIEEISMPKGWYYKSGTNQIGIIPSNSAANSSVTNEYIARGQATIQAHKDLDGASLSSGQFEFMLTEDISEVHKTPGFDDEGNLIETDDVSTKTDVVLLPDITDIHVYMKYLAYYCAPAFAYPKGNAANGYFWQGTYNGSEETIVQGETDFDVHGIEYPKECAIVLGNVYGYNVAQQKNVASQYYAVLTKIIDTAVNGPVDTKEEITDEKGNVVKNPYYGTAPVIFDAIEYTKPGEYVYYVHEIEGGDSSVNYDKTKQTVRVIVEDNGNGTLSTEVIYESKDGDEPVFSNSMKPGDLVVSKKLSNGTDATKDVKFSFRLLLKDSDGADLTGKYTVKLPDGTTKEITNGDTVSIKADEEFTVCGLPHGCQYEIIELPQDGFTLAEAKDDTGVIEGGETSYAEFSNVYSASNVLVLKAKKQFIGGTISPGQFAFELVDQNSQHIETVYADENGEVVFSPINFTEADVGTHLVYYIFEVSRNDDHIIYDTHTADVGVTIFDNADGTIGFDIDYDEADLVFTNVALYDLEISKTVAGNMGNKNDEFTFNMVLSNDEYELGNSIQYRKGDETGDLTISGDHYEFTLMHDETITFIGLPVGTEYKIVETGAEEYGTSVTITASEKTKKVNNKQVSDTLKADTAVSYVNTIDSRVPTDATTVYIWVAALMIMAFAVFLIISKRKRV